MMNSRSLGFTVLSVLFAGIAVFMAKNWLDNNRPKDVKVDEVQAIAMSVSVSAGTVLEQKHLSVRSFPRSMAPKNVSQSMEAVVGKVARHPMLEGDFVRPEKLAEKGEGSVLASLIESNMRAVTIRVDDVVGVAGFLLPGNRVDVLMTRSSRENASTDVVLSNLKVLAVDQVTGTDANKPILVRAVTLEVSLEQAEVLMNARSRGSIQLALRNPNDKSAVELAEAKPEPVVAAVEPRRLAPSYEKRKIEVIRGVSMQTVTVD
ncbi:Flp pilus assembly protein CpaB [Marinobacter sp. F4216]|nr:Flp pilus assembly protein CpaB [Marinobacter sp. F4216]